MSESILLALINQMPQILQAVGLILTAIIGGFTFWLTWHVKKNTDGMTTKMVASAKVEGNAEGKEEGKAEEQANPTTLPIAKDNRRKPRERR